MAQHFLLSKAAKTLTLAQVMRMSDAEAETLFRKVRWANTDGEPVCPKCGALDAYQYRRPNGALRFECSACRKEFSITSGTLFGSHKLPLRGYLAANDFLLAKTALVVIRAASVVVQNDIGSSAAELLGKAFDSQNIH